MHKKEISQVGLLTMDDGIINWVEHTEEEEPSNHALMAISSNSEVSLCSKLCIDSYNSVKAICDEQTNQIEEQEIKILAYENGVKTLEAQVDKLQTQLANLNQKLTFQANEIYAKDEKLKKYRRIGEKALKDKEELQQIVDKWKNSSQNLSKLISSGMSSTCKIGLGYEIKSDSEVLSYEEEMDRSMFTASDTNLADSVEYSRFLKTNNYKGVPPPLSGDYTPLPEKKFDESLYVYGKKGSQVPETNVSEDKTSEYSTCQSNDSEESLGNTSEPSESEPESVSSEVSRSNSVKSDKPVVSEPEQKPVEPSCETHLKSPRQQVNKPETPKREKNDKWNRVLGGGYVFTQKRCFVCNSISHLIKDCDFHEKRMAKENELRKQRVVNTGNVVAKPVWNNVNRINHANQFVPRQVLLNTGKTNVNSAHSRVNTGHSKVNSGRPNVNTGRSQVKSVGQKVNPVYPKGNTGYYRPKQPVKPQVNQANHRNHFAKSYSPVRRPISQVNNFNQRRNFSKSISPVRRPIVNNTAKISNSYAVKGKGGLLLET